MRCVAKLRRHGIKFHISQSSKFYCIFHFNNIQKLSCWLFIIHTELHRSVLKPPSLWSLVMSSNCILLLQYDCVAKDINKVHTLKQMHKDNEEIIFKYFKNLCLVLSNNIYKNSLSWSLDSLTLTNVWLILSLKNSSKSLHIKMIRMLDIMNSHKWCGFLIYFQTIILSLMLKSWQM